VQWLEPVAGATSRDMPTYRAIPASDPRTAQAERMIDNEAARFVRRVIAAAHRIATPGADKPLPPLPIVFQRGGNNARTGFYLAEGESVRAYPGTPYVLLDFDADRLSLTFLHEGGHVADRIVRAGTRPESEWSGIPHSTFAVTDRVTALSEGFAIHFETLWGHYGTDVTRRGWYHRTDPVWSGDFLRTEFFAPVRDIMTFSQNWARYSAVRDGLPMFEGHVYDGDYLRSQYDPARDRSRLKTANAIVASEGAVASVCFWIAEGYARAAGVKPQGGLEQAGLVEAEIKMLTALRSAARGASKGTIDLADVVAAVGTAGSEERRQAIERFVMLTRAATMAPRVRSGWRHMYTGAVALDLQASRKTGETLAALSGKALQDAIADPARLRVMTGPVLPVRLDRAKLRLVALGEAFPAEFDLNAMGMPELFLLSPDAGVRAKIDAALDEAPFRSIEDFETRTGITLASVGATPVR
jgi:hypothetical protein